MPEATKVTLNVSTMNQSLSDSVRQSVNYYLSCAKQNKKSTPINLYERVIAAFELSLMITVMEHTKGNQLRAAVVLGLSRSAFRKSLKKYGMLRLGKKIKKSVTMRT